jgi:hypothetical protein
MPDAEGFRKYALACLRLRADCVQLAEDAPTSALRRHYAEMAEAWAERAESGPDAGVQITDPDDDPDLPI